LAYKQVIFKSFSKESRIGLSDFEAISDKEISKAFIPCSWGLLEPIKRLRELITWFTKPLKTGGKPVGLPKPPGCGFGKPPVFFQNSFEIQKI
jgi:hypothetical protein